MKTTIDVLEFRSRPVKKKPVSIIGISTLLFGACEVMKQGFAENGSCWLMAVGVASLIYGVMKVWKG